MHYALGYLALNHPNYRVAAGADWNGDPFSGYTNYAYRTQSRELGWEVDIGLAVELLDNLHFTSVFGYMFSGDAYRELQGYTITGTADSGYRIEARWGGGQDAYTWMNALTFSF